VIGAHLHGFLFELEQHKVEWVEVIMNVAAGC